MTYPCDKDNHLFDPKWPIAYINEKGYFGVPFGPSNMNGQFFSIKWQIKQFCATVKSFF